MQCGIRGKGGALGVDFGTGDRLVAFVRGAHAGQIFDRQQERFAGRCEARSRQQLVVDLIQQIDVAQIAARGRVGCEHVLVAARQRIAALAEPINPTQQATRGSGIDALRIGGEIVMQSRIGAIDELWIRRRLLG